MFWCCDQERIQDFPQGVPTPKGDGNLLFPEECSKTKKIGPRGARPKFYSVEPPLVTAELRWSLPSNLVCALLLEHCVKKR